MVLEEIKKSGKRNFEAKSILNGKVFRCAIEETGSIFVYAPKKKRYGWRYTEEDFLQRFEPLMPADENKQWKRRLKRAVKLCNESGLWKELAVVWDNLYKYVPLEEKNKISKMYWNEREVAIAYCRKHYPFMVKTNQEGEEFLDTDYIWELSDCKLKSMYFGHRNEEEKAQIRKAIAEQQPYTIPHITAGYDISFSYTPDMQKAWYSEEYRNCGNGHYYLALNHSTAVFCEND